MKRMNLGCGPDIKEGWLNINATYIPQYEKDKVEIWDARGSPHWNYTDYDFILVNHVLNTIVDEDARKVIANCYEMLREGGKVQIIEMDILKAYKAYIDNNAQHIPILGELTIDEKLVKHLSGFSTRLSLYTPNYLCTLLQNAGFKGIKILDKSEYDTRPNESLIVEGIK